MHARVEAAAGRAAEESADVDQLLPVVEEIEQAVGHQCEPVAHVPAEVVVEKPQRLAEVVAIFFREPGDVGVEGDPVDIVAGAGDPNVYTLNKSNATPTTIGPHGLGDISGFASAELNLPIPTLSEAGILILVLLVGVAGALAIRFRPV